MRSQILKVTTLGLCVCALLAACSPQDGSAPPAASQAPTTTTAARNSDTAAPQTTKQTPAAPTPAAEQTRRISIEESQAAVAAGTAILVDVRDENTYKTSHIKGAKNIPLPRFDQRLGELPKDKLIITYCAWPSEQTSARAVQMLNAKGNTNAAAMTGGWNAWIAAKLPVESAQWNKLLAISSQQ